LVPSLGRVPQQQVDDSQPVSLREPEGKKPLKPLDAGPETRLSGKRRRMAKLPIELSIPVRVLKRSSGLRTAREWMQLTL
jgi:hypothetical protein